MLPTALATLAVVALWLGWRFHSHRALLPCPSEFSWLVELENPLARATRSAHIVRQLAPRPGDRVIDVGCGPGRVTLPLARAVGPAGEVIALDVQPAMLAKVAAKARRAALAQIRPLASAASVAEFPALDGAVMVMALGEIPQRAEVLRALSSALRPGGRLLVAESLFDPHFVRRREVRTLARSTGFIETSCTGNSFGYAMLFTKPAVTDNPPAGSTGHVV